MSEWEYHVHLSRLQNKIDFQNMLIVLGVFGLVFLALCVWL